ncbi:MAG: LPS export ABC transporter ATP-binding protein [Alphaproteobacteria bacterium]|nr:LPS export ABC transporter ATP-binding protein [Alphaproteobacteria bacterium]OJV11961.1 MAG: LPS export ABC transporter ATP-binding protein [Alphaproteobacteria bacterium 33-17]
MALKAYNLSKTYGSRTVVADVSFDLSRGEVVGLLGPNGAGKTTCFYMIAGLVDCDKGKITVGDLEVTKMPMYRRAQLGIGYLPQESSIFRGLTVAENIMAVLEIVEKSSDERKRKLDKLLSDFSIKHLAQVISTTLSGGERRRLEIARAIATNPSFLLLDEPFAGVDPVSVDEIRSLINYLSENGIGVLITDHNVRETLSIVDRAYIVHEGRILMQGTPEQVIASPEVRKVYLGESFKS